MTKNLRQLRAEKDWSQADLAEKAGLDPSSISLWENGRNLPDTASVIKLAAAFGISAGEVLEAALRSKPRQHRTKNQKEPPEVRPSSHLATALNFA